MTDEVSEIQRILRDLLVVALLDSIHFDSQTNGFSSIIVVKIGALESAPLCSCNSIGFVSRLINSVKSTASEYSCWAGLSWFPLFESRYLKPIVAPTER